MSSYEEEQKHAAALMVGVARGLELLLRDAGSKHMLDSRQRTQMNEVADDLEHNATWLQSYFKEREERRGPD